MNCFRVESSCKFTGGHQATEILNTREEVLIYCTEPWRRDSVHVVYELPSGAAPRLVSVYVAGVCVSMLLLHWRKAYRSS